MPAVTLPAIPLEQLPQPDASQLQKDGLDAGGFTTHVPDQDANWLAIGIVLLLIVLALLMPAIVRKWRRARPPADVSRQMATLWRRALGAIEATGCRIDPSLTPLEQARAVSPRLPVRAPAEVARRGGDGGHLRHP